MPSPTYGHSQSKSQKKKKKKDHCLDTGICTYLTVSMQAGLGKF